MSKDYNRNLPRVTVATVIEYEGRFLMVEENIRGRTVINQPSGHLEPNEELTAAAIRETLEETGWQIEINGLIDIARWNSEYSHYLRFCFSGKAIKHQPLQPLDHGIIAARWLSREQIVNAKYPLRTPLVLHHIDLYIKGVTHSLDIFNQS